MLNSFPPNSFIDLRGACVIGAAFVFASHAKAQFSYAFDLNQADVSANFVSTGTISSAWANNAGTGVPATGGLNSSNAARGTYWNASFDTLGTIGGSVTLSVDFRGRAIQPGISTFSGNIASIGISNSTTSTLFNASGTFLGVALTDSSNIAGDYTSRLEILSRNNGGAVLVGNSSVTSGTNILSVDNSDTVANINAGQGSFTRSGAAFSLVDNNWYRLTVTIAKTSDSFFSVDAGLYDLGSTGVNVQSTLATATNVSISSSALAS